MFFLITICKISSRFRYFGMDLVSYRAIFPVSVQLNHIHPLRQNRNGAKIKSTPTHLYHTKILGYISSNAHISPTDHTIKGHTRSTTYIRKKILHSFQTDNHRKRHSHSLPRYNRLYNISPDHHKPDNHTSHSRQKPYNVIMSERITVQVPESNIVNQSTHTTTAQHPHTADTDHVPILGICVNLV